MFSNVVKSIWQQFIIYLHKIFVIKEDSCDANVLRNEVSVVLIINSTIIIGVLMF